MSLGPASEDPASEGPASQGPASHGPVSQGPVSEALVGELREEARKHGTLVWLDKDGHYGALVDALRANGALGFPVLGYRGSYLELVLALEGFADGVHNPPLLVHMPQHNEDEIAQTSLYELYCAGRRYRIALATAAEKAAEGRLTPEQRKELTRHSFGSLAEADEWMEQALSGEERLEVSPRELFDDLVAGGGLAARLDEPGFLPRLQAALERRLGLGAGWARPQEDPREALREVLREALFRWALCVEFVHDLKRAPEEAMLTPLKALPADAVTASRELARHARAAHPELYVREADRLEAELEARTREVPASELGRVDTFRFEDRTIFRAALDALRAGRWVEAAEYALARGPEGPEGSFWGRVDEGRRVSWSLVAHAAELGRALAEHWEFLASAHGLDEAAERYAAGAFEVDRAQRRLEQARARSQMLVPGDEFPVVREALDGLRLAYRKWADDTARRFSALCREHGFLPEAPLRQRELFAQAVAPLVAQGTVAYVLVDALRFEMGRELADALAQEGAAKVELVPRFAELPTLTEVGMNVLAGVSRGGRLEPQIDLEKGTILGFRAGPTLVSSPEARRKALHEQVGGETCPLLSVEEILGRDVSSLRRSIARARLVVVESRAIDKAGEEGLGLRHFEDELVRVRAAVGLLREAGVRRFVLAADHGFLIQDELTRSALPHGRKIDAKRRHLITPVAADHSGEVRVAISALRYDVSLGPGAGSSNGEPQLVFPESSQPFDVGKAAKDFLHGGNSLQERLIPLITVVYRAARGEDVTRYRVIAQAGSAVLGMHRLVVRVERDSAQGGLEFAAPEEVELRLDALDGSGVVAELVDAPGAGIAGGVLLAPLDRDFELLFRLSGPRPLRTRVELRAALGMDAVIPAELERRFAVEVVGAGSGEDAPAAEGQDADEALAWLEAFADQSVRAVFAHIHKHGAINEADATELLGTPRRFRRFSKELETHAQKAPFGVHVFEQLRKGLVPERGLEAFAVGIERQRAEIHRQLELIEQGEGTIKFLRGGYGCGKTFMARLALLDAQARGYATSFVVVSDNDLRFYRFDEVYRKVVSELGTATCPRGPWATSSTAGSPEWRRR
jgi:hypothetical protein